MHLINLFKFVQLNLRLEDFPTAEDGGTNSNYNNTNYYSFLFYALLLYKINKTE